MHAREQAAASQYRLEQQHQQKGFFTAAITSSIFDQKRKEGNM